MRVPLSWLRDHVDLDESTEALRDLLTFAGLEVEGVEVIGSSFEGIVVARIDAVARHPDADRLTLCTIDYGADAPLTVVCGAPNVRVGMHTIYAPVGATLPNGLKLKKAKIRGVESLGMLCAEDELGLSKAHEGILDLPGAPAPGTPAAEVLGGPEVVFDLEITPNRPDCLCILGVARELAALTGRALRLPEASLSEIANDPAGAHATVTVADAKACPRYTARVLKNIRVAPAPEWMQKRLKLCGVRPINNVVDITNYVMLECGQPLHAFDHALLRGSAIQVRPAREGEILHTLDGQARVLAPRHLVIADAERPVALAGVMGGADSEIRDETRTVLLESAAFDSVPVRASAKEFHLHTESSHRFARGCDAHNAEWVSRRAAHLLQAHAGATVCGGAIDVWPSPTPRREIRARWERITRLIGVDIPVDTLLGFLRRLGLEIVEHDAAGCLVRVPGFRNDLLREVDLTEEIARLHGLDRIPSPAPIARVIPGANDRRNDQRMALCRAMAGMGLFEAFHYSLTSPELLASLDPSGQARQVRLPNPISQDQAVLRTSLIPQMVETLARNKARQNLRVGLFELGTVFHQGAEGVEESQRLSIGLLGPVGRSPLDRERPVGDAEAFYWLKGMVENLLASRRLAPVRWEASDDAAFAPGQAARVLWQDQEIGRIGLVRADIRQGWKIHEPLAVGEIAVEALLARANKPVSMQPVPSIPCSSRDVALIVDRATAHAAVMDLVAEKRPAELESVELFDIFEGKKLGENRKSMAYRFTYRGRQQTLSDEAVEKLHRPIVERLMARLPAEIAGQNAPGA